MFLLYVLRSVFRRWAVNGVTISALALSIGGCVVMFSYAAGIRRAIDASGPDNVVIVMLRGARTESQSSLTKAVVNELSVLDGVSKDGDVRLVSPEVLWPIDLDHPDGAVTPLMIRGTDPVAALLRPGYRLVEGKAAVPGTRELVIGSRLLGSHPELKVGGSIPVGNQRYAVVGVFSAGGAGFEGEAWTDRGVFTSDYHLASFGSVRLTTDSAAAATALIEKVNATERLEVSALSARSYYLNNVGALNEVLGYIFMLVGLLSVGAIATAATTLQASLLSRLGEFAMLNLIGVHRGALARLVLAEALVLTAAGTAIGLGAAAMTDGRAAGDLIPFQLTLTSAVMVQGLGLGLVIGVLGSLAPQIAVARMNALRTA